MTFQDDLADDVDNVFLNTSEYAVSATFKAKGDATGFAVSVVFGDPDPSTIQVIEGNKSTRSSRILVDRTVIRAGIAAALGTARDPLRGDELIVASGADAGTWRVQEASPDLGDAIVLDARLSTPRVLGGQNAEAVR